MTSWPFKGFGARSAPLTREFKAILGIATDEPQERPEKPKRPAYTPPAKPAGPWIDKKQRASDLARLAEIKQLSKGRRKKEGRKMHAKIKEPGFTRAQLARWGVPWPPLKGWKKKLEAQGIVCIPEGKKAKVPAGQLHLTGAEEQTHVHRDGSATVTRRATGSVEEVFVRHIEARKPSEAPSLEEAVEAMKTLGSDLCACGHERQEHAYGIGCPRQPEGAFRLAEASKVSPAPGYDEVLEGLRFLRRESETTIEEEHLDAAIAYLEALPESVRWSEMPGDTAFRCMECDWQGPYQALRFGVCPFCPACGSDEVVATLVLLRCECGDVQTKALLGWWTLEQVRGKEKR